MNQGVNVVAGERITEQGYREQDEFVHAEAGDRGVVLEVVDHEWLMIRWSRNDSVAQCLTEELRLPEADAA